MTYLEMEYLQDYEDDVRAILECCNNHNMSLHTCRQIIELMTSVCDEKSPSGAVRWLNDKVINWWMWNK